MKVTIENLTINIYKKENQHTCGMPVFREFVPEDSNGRHVDRSPSMNDPTQTTKQK